MQEGKYAYTKEDAIAQGKMQTRKGKFVQEQVQRKFGELRRGKSIDDNRWE